MYVSTDGGHTYTAWFSNTTLTAATFPGVVNHTYYFYVVAMNNVGTLQTNIQTVTASTAAAYKPQITSAITAEVTKGQPFSYQITANNSPVSFNASGLPAGLAINTASGLISGIPTAAGVYPVVLSATNTAGTGTVTLTLTVTGLPGHVAFFTGEAALGNGVYYLSFANGNYFGYYGYLNVAGDPYYLYHFDLGYEYIFDAADGNRGVYFYDFASQTFFYTSPTFPFPYLYDFTLNTVLYYYPDPNHAGRYNTNGYRFFYRFDTGQIFVK